MIDVLKLFSGIRTKLKQRYLHPRFSFLHVQFFVFTAIVTGIIVGITILTNEVIIPRLFASTSPWTQTDWSGGTTSGTVTGTVTTYESLSDLDATSASGQISLTETTGWSNTYSDWNRKQLVTITNSDTERTNYQVKITVTFDADMQSDFDDIRFTNSAGTALDYWLQSKIDSTSAVVWVEVDSLVASGDTTIDMYYGNSSASSGSNGENTFIFFDDFDDGTIDTNKWVEVDQAGGDEITESGGKLKFTRLSNDTWDKTVYGVDTYTRSDLSFEMDYVWTVNNSVYDALMFGWHDNTAGVSYTNLVYAYYNSGSGTASTVTQNIYEDGSSRGSGESWTVTQDYDVTVRMRESGGAYYDYSTDSGETWTNRYTTTYSTESNLRPGWAFYSGSHEFDNARIRQWMTSEPTSSAGNEIVKYASSGTLTSNILNAEFPADWGTLSFTSSGTGTVGVKVRSDSNSDMSGATAWGSCGSISSGTDLSSTDCVTDTDQYLQYQVSLEPSGGSTPVFEDISIAFSASDIVVPTTNASSVAITAVTDGTWTNTEPTITWTAGADNVGGSGLLGYCIALDEATIGNSSSLDPATTGGTLLSALDDGVSQSYCDFIVTGTSVDLSAISGLTLTSGKQYYLSMKAVDIAGNIWTGVSGEYQDLVSFKYDGTAPSNPSYFSLPGDFIATKSATLIWPTSGGSEASDSHSGVAGLQYRIGSGGTWYGDTHNGNQDATDLLTNDGSYTFIQSPDFDSIDEGSNLIYMRTFDAVGNVSATYISGALKVNTTSPSTPQDISVTPETSTSNAFAFSWSAPTTYTGQVGNITYCYTVNALPTSTNCSWTSAGTTSLDADAFANQPGENTFYLVAKDEAGNVNYDTYASTTFTANTSAPGIPENIDIADVSVKATSSWKLAISREEPSAVGAGVSNYKIFHSTDNSTYSEESTLTGISYVDTSLTQTTHYYKVKACDSANNCGAFTEAVSLLPDGKFTEASSLTSGPTVTGVTTKKATISWGTDRDSDSKVSYGTGSGNYFSEEPSNSTQDTDHTINLTNLSPGTTYFYKAKWTDEDGNTGESDEKTFTTDPAPTITDPKAVSIGITSATLEFTVIGADKTKIYYGESTSFGGLKEVPTSTSESSYTVILDGLLDGTKYFYKINAFDTEGAEYEGNILTFETLPRPRISQVRLQQVRNTAQPTALVTWSTNTPTSSIITYYPEGTPGQARDEVNVSLKEGVHQMILRGLSPQTPYILIVKGVDKAGNQAESDPQRFTTATDTRPPLISNLKIEGSTTSGDAQQAMAQLIVTWNTDEVSTSQVEFGEGTGSTYSQKTQEDTNQTFNHLVVISGLTPSKVYHLRATSTDKAGNISQSIDSVTITPKATENALDLVVTNLQQVFGFLGGI